MPIAWVIMATTVKSITMVRVPPTEASCTTGDVIGVALDLTDGTITFYKDGVSPGTAYTTVSNLGTPIYPMVSAYGEGSGFALTMAFASNSFKYSPPSGYAAWDSSLPNATTGIAYSQTIPATGGSGSGYTFTVSSGSLPPGLSLSSGGVLSGTATTAGSYNFTVQVTDSAGDTNTMMILWVYSAAFRLRHCRTRAAVFPTARRSLPLAVRAVDTLSAYRAATCHPVYPYPLAVSFPARQP